MLSTIPLLHAYARLPGEVYGRAAAAFKCESALNCIQNNLQSIAPDDFLLITVVRNQSSRVPFFLSYYQSLGIDHFLVVDNMSTDGTREAFLNKTNCSVWSADQDYKSSFGLDWINLLLHRHAQEHWILCVDIDEFFIYPDFEHRPARDLLNFLTASGRRSMFAPLIDMYSRGSISSAHYHSGADPLRVCPYLDRTGYVRGRNANGGIWLRGGPRLRCFYADDPYAAPALNKIPLVRWGSDCWYLVSTHEIYPFALNEVHTARPMPTGALLHYKFFSDFHDQASREARRGQHWQDGAEYRRYANVLRDEPDLSFYSSVSTRFTGSRQLENLGLISKGIWR